MHAHRCENCAKQGTNTVWIHGDCAQGNPEAHTCPKCGHKEWKKWLVPVGQLPAHGGAQPQAGLLVVPLDQLLIVLFYAALILVSASVVTKFVQSYIEKKAAVK
jgi:hypothetical protein